MNNKNFLRWVLELATQEYQGDIGMLKFACHNQNLMLEGAVLI